MLLDTHISRVHSTVFFYFYSIVLLFLFDSRAGRDPRNALRTFRWASNLQRAACFICKVREESQLCGGTLSFVIHGGDRLSAVVRFGSNMSYVRRASWRATGRLPRTSRGRSRTIGGCINVKRSRRRKQKNKAIITLDNEAMSVWIEGGGRGGGVTARKGRRVTGWTVGDRWKKKKEKKKCDRVTARTCLPRPAFTLHDWTNNELNAIRPRQYALSVGMYGRENEIL